MTRTTDYRRFTNEYVEGLIYQSKQLELKIVEQHYEIEKLRKALENTLEEFHD